MSVRRSAAAAPKHRAGHGPDVEGARGADSTASHTGHEHVVEDAIVFTVGSLPPRGRMGRLVARPAPAACSPSTAPRGVPARQRSAPCRDRTLPVPGQACCGRVYFSSVSPKTPGRAPPARVVVDQFRRGVDVIVVVVVLAVVVEPRLDAFREVLVVVDRRVLARPTARLHGGVVRLPQPSVERGSTLTMPRMGCCGRTRG
jgi:hypothetical protein